MNVDRRTVIIAAATTVALLATVVGPVRAELPFGDQGPSGGDPYDYTRFHITNGSCDGIAPDEPVPPGSDLPASFDCRGHWKLADSRMQPGEADYDPLVAENPQELLGVRGPGTNRAWEVTTGRPDTVIAVMDSGIRWDENRPDLMRKFFLNRGELPVPGGEAKGGPLTDYDVNGDGFFNVEDYAGDSRVVDHPDDDNELVDPSDLIRVFSDGVDDDGNGYVDDISGWDFFEGDNDPNDDVDYGHGTGESEDSAGEVDVTGVMPQCPNCMLLEMRVGDSFVADVNHFAEAAVYATDNGASVIQSALGTLNHTGFAQAAADYAWDRGVLFVASAADEEAPHHNYPSALNHTMTMNSVTKFVDGVQNPKTYLSFNGCTNFGGYIWAAVASTSCSSDAVGQSAGQAGLVYSAARNAVDLGIIEPHPGAAGRPLSASEAKQIFRLGADDIDFSTPKPPAGPPNNFVTTLPASQRYVTTEGWDQITGWGRTNTESMVNMVIEGHIPPEADLTSPRWWEPLGTTGTVDVVGRAAAPRASSFSYRVEVAAGVQPPRWPLADQWVTVAESGPHGSPVEGTLATLDLAEVRALIDAAPPVYTPVDDPTSRDLPEKDVFRVRLVVQDDRPDTGDAVEHRPAYSSDDPALLEGWPRFLDADGAGSPAFADLDGDNVDELVISDGNGLVHAFKADGSEAPGWPARTAALDLPTWEDPVHAPVLLGTPAVADLDGDGRPEVAVADIEGNLWVYDHQGAVRPGFPVRGNPAFSEETACNETGGGDCDDYGPRDVRDRINTVDRAFVAAPAVGDLDPATPGRELVIGSNDGHVYAFAADGSAIDGWPVLLRDPAKVAAVDPITHKVTFVDGSGVKFGRKVIAGVSLGDVDGDGDLEVAANVNEEYEEAPNWSAVREVTLPVVGAVSGPGNTRTYLLHHDGTAHAPTTASGATPHPDDQAYVEGWPVPIAMLVLELLPYVGEGSNGAPVLGDVDGDGTLEVFTASIAGPPYLLRADGSSFYGDGPDGKYLTMASSAAEGKGVATDYPSIASLGGGVVGDVGGTGRLDFAMGSTGLRRLLDVLLPEQQLGAEDHISAWDAATGTFALGFPAQMNDLMFFNTPAIADVDGDGRADVLQSSAVNDFRAYGAGGVPIFNRLTGGWSVTTPGVGDLDGDGVLEVALPTREGNLFVWRTSGDACQAPEWGQYQHDLANSGSYHTDARPPAAVTEPVAWTAGDGLALRFTAPGGDGLCGSAATYEVLVSGEVVAEVDAAAAAGEREELIVEVGGSPSEVEVRAVDGAGNRGFPVAVAVGSAPDDDGPAPGDGGGDPSGGVIGELIALLEELIPLP